MEFVEEEVVQELIAELVDLNELLWLMLIEKTDGE
jgi:hypothetical protein